MRPRISTSPLPPPRTFPLEESGVQAGNLTLRAWIVTPEPEKCKHSSSSAGYPNDSEMHTRGVAPRNTSAGSHEGAEVPPRGVAQRSTSNAVYHNGAEIPPRYVSANHWRGKDKDVVTPGLEEGQRRSSAGYRNNAEVPPRGVSNILWRSEDEDENTLYELSESSDKTCSVPGVVPGTSYSRGSTASRLPLTSEASAACAVQGKDEEGLPQGDRVLLPVHEPLRRGSASAGDIRESRKSGDEPPLSAGNYTLSKLTSGQHGTIETAAAPLENKAHQKPPPRSSASSSGDAATTAYPVRQSSTTSIFPDPDIELTCHDSAGGAPHPRLTAVDTGMVDHGGDPAGVTDRDFEPPLDLTESLLALAPSYPVGHAEVRVWVHGIFVGRDLISAATPPYVRFSLPPRVHDGMARTGSLHAPILTETTSQVTRAHGIARADPLQPPFSTYTMSQITGRTYDTNRNRDSITTKKTPTAKCVVQYLPKEGDAGRHVSLSLGPSGESVFSPPALRLEIVGGRSLGRCDLSLTEALRHPGSTLRQIEAPIWKKEPIEEDEAKGEPDRVNRDSSGDRPAGDDVQQNEAFSCGGRRFSTGKVLFDVGVRLTGDAAGRTAPERNMKVESTTSYVKVEAIGLRVTGTRGGVDFPSRVARHCHGITGISAELALGAEKTMFATFDPTHEGVSGQCVDLTSADGVGFSQTSSAVLKSMCTEVDVLVLRLQRRPSEQHLGSPQVVEISNRRDPEGSREGGTGKGRGTLSIAVSDINDCFCGRAQWLAVDVFREKNDSARKAGSQTTRGLGRAGPDVHRLEIQLRVSVTQENPANQHPLGDAVSEDGKHHARGGTACGDGWLVDGSAPQPGTCCITSSPVKQSAVFGELNSDASWSAFEAWLLSPQNSCEQSRTIVSSFGGNARPARARRTLNFVDGDGDASGSGGPGPGELQLEVIAIHGQAADMTEADRWQEASMPETDNLNGFIAETPIWWVRITVSDGGGGSVTSDSPPGDVEEGVWEGGQDAAGLKYDGVVRWAASARARVRCAVHWTPRRRVLPTASLSIFRGKVGVFPEIFASCAIQRSNFLYVRNFIFEKTGHP